jgi:3-methyladenine DNA glycosylase/8-oxoguanine DNA glycosylase
MAWRGGAVEVSVLAKRECDGEMLEAAYAAARGIAGVDDDPTDFLRSVARHPVLGKLVKRGADPRMTRTPTVFEAFVFSVLGQLVTSWEAREAYVRLGWLAGERIEGTKLKTAPTPAGLRSVPMWKLHAVGVGSRRAATLRGGALRGDAIERLKGVDPAVAVEKLQSLRGVGPWTANGVARSALGWSDAVPVGDLHAKTFVTLALSGEAGDDAAMVEVLEPFRPHRARVVQLLEGFSVPGAEPRRLPRVDKHRREPWRY